MIRLLNILLVVITIFLCGCNGLVKKFIRKPKVQPLQVVKPKSEYQLDPRAIYERHFVFAKVWMDEFRSSLDSPSKKRQRESLEQAVRNLEILNDYIPEKYAEKKEKLTGYIQKLRKIYADLQELQRARLPLTRIKNRIEELRRSFHRDFLPSRQPEGFFKDLLIQ